MITRKRYKRYINETLTQYFLDHKTEPGIANDFLVVYKGAMDKVDRVRDAGAVNLENALMHTDKPELGHDECERLLREAKETIDALHKKYGIPIEYDPSDTPREWLQELSASAFDAAY